MNLPILLGAIRQEAGDGEFTLEQTDGVRQLRFLKGEVVHLRSDAAGEQFGSYLIRQGVLDLGSLNHLLAQDGGHRIGEKVLQEGMVSPEARDRHLRCLQERIMTHALEHPILRWTWTPDPPEGTANHGVKLRHRRFIWNTFHGFQDPADLLRVLAAEPEWRWEGRPDLLDHLDDLPFTSTTAFALSFFTAEPISFETFRFLSRLEEDEAGRLLAALWALGALVLSNGRRPSVAAPPPSVRLEPKPRPKLKPKPEPKPEAKQGLPLILPPPGAPFGPPKLRALDIPENLDHLAADLACQPEFLDAGGEPRTRQDPPSKAMDADLPLDLAPWPEDMPPCGPRPQARPEALLWPADLPPGGPPLLVRPETVLWPADQSPSGPPLPVRPEPVPGGPPPQAGLPLRTVAIDLDPSRRGAPGPPRAAARLKDEHLLEKVRRQVKQGRTLEAILSLEKIVEGLPDGDAAFVAWLLLGNLRMSNPNWNARALHALQNAVRICPGEAEPWTRMGELHRRMGDSRQAEACFRKSLALDPSQRVPPGLGRD